MENEKTRASRSSQQIQALREPPLSLLVPEGYREDPKAYVRWRGDALEIAPELVARVRR